MATMEPDDDDETFRRLMSGVDFGELADQQAPDYSKYDTRRLVEEFEAARRALADTGEMVYPKSEKAVNLSAVYHGLLGELRKRRL